MNNTASAPIRLHPWVAQAPESQFGPARRLDVDSPDGDYTFGTLAFRVDPGTQQLEVTLPDDGTTFLRWAPRDIAHPEILDTREPVVLVPLAVLERYWAEAENAQNDWSAAHSAGESGLVRVAEHAGEVARVRLAEAIDDLKPEVRS